MHPRPLGFAFVFVLLTAAAAGEPAGSDGPRSIAREAIREFKFQPRAKSEEIPAVLRPKTDDAPVMLPVYQVKALPDRTFHDLNDSLAHLKTLESKALVKAGQWEIFFPFDSILEKDTAGQARACLPILRYRF